jgi:acetyl-CoA carboxylase biotin carboxylase subunit
MFKKILIANRGDIALRVIRACQELGIRTVAVYSEADRDSLHVRFADQAVCIGPARSARSYLNVPALIGAAEVTGADAIHPGYGFLSESGTLADICQACRITFIGPPARAIRLMGNKSAARNAMIAAGVPVVPGSQGVLGSEHEGGRLAREIGFPVILKASAGGGGRGMRVVRSAGDLAPAFRAAQAEAQAAFGIADVYLEKYVEAPRHVEIQLMADSHGHVVHLGERDCSVQRRHQKLIEESPSPALHEKLRHEMGRAAVEAARAVGYVNAGTVEFLLSGHGDYYFMEMNTRIQVEHGVTELVTGRDLVKEQILVAAGARLSFAQKEIAFTGHALECRINAEDPDSFRPSPGLIRSLHLPGGPGVRWDTAMYAGAEVSPHYDSLVAKLMVHGRDRAEAIARMQRCLAETVVEGIKTSIPLHQRILRSPSFQAGRVDTHFLEWFQDEDEAQSVRAVS